MKTIDAKHGSITTVRFQDELVILRYPNNRSCVTNVTSNAVDNQRQRMQHRSLIIINLQVKLNKFTKNETQLIYTILKIAPESFCRRLSL